MTDKLRAAAEAAIGAMVRAAITGHADALDGYAEALRAALAEPDQLRDATEMIGAGDAIEGPK